MAIGLGRMFGFSFVENFNYPYISKSVTEFWRRWHISLSSWFRDYVYIPLGGNRCTKCRWIFNLFVVWTLTGIWHGANWTFLLWGLLYFVFLLIEKITKINTKLGYGAYVTTAVLVMINWVIFKADTIVSAGAYLGNMVGIGAVGGLIGEDFSVYGLSSVFILVISVLGATPILKKTFEWLAQRKMEWIESVWLVFIFLLSLIHSVAATYSPFIYFNF
jgi:alginate O-acetyltransferase complex protein AlgI